MRTFWRCAAFIAMPAVIGFGTLAAAAQERPPFPPTRDVAVTYRMENGNQPTSARLAWLRRYGPGRPQGGPHPSALAGPPHVSPCS
jgi:hypothetical protein